MKYLFILLSVFACGTLFAQKKHLEYRLVPDMLFREVNGVVFNGNVVLDVPINQDTLFVSDKNKFIKMPTGEVYKIVRETKLERVFEISGYFNSSTAPFYYQFNGDTKRLRSF